MFLDQNHPICQGKAKPSGSLGAVVAAAAVPPQGCVEGAAAWWCRRGSSLSRAGALLWVGWRAWVGGAWSSCGGEALACGAGRRSGRRDQSWAPIGTGIALHLRMRPMPGHVFWGHGPPPAPEPLGSRAPAHSGARRGPEHPRPSRPNHCTDCHRACSCASDPASGM